jgi:acid phosphatase (class A)
MAHELHCASSRIVGWPLLLATTVLSAAAVFAASSVAAAASGAAAAASTAISRPAPAAAPTRPSAAHYLSSPQVDLVRLLPPPPAADSPAQQTDLQAVLDAQRAARTDGTLGQAIADVEASCGRFSDVLGDALTSQRNAGVLEFLNRAAREGASIAGPAKKYWKRTRPYAFSGEVEALGDMAPAWNAKPAMDGSRAATELAHSSYPSGHATFGTVCTILLADMVPEKREALFARGRQYAHSRMVVGAHYPSDLEAGRIAGTLATQRLLQNRNFQRDLAAARAKLRAALGLPASAPDLEPQAIYKSGP